MDIDSLVLKSKATMAEYVLDKHCQRKHGMVIMDKKIVKEFRQ